MPSYAKFLEKKILYNTRKLEDHENVVLTADCSAIVKSNLSPMLKDPGSFSTPCVIGMMSFKRELCDLGAIVSMMPLSVCQKLDLGDVKSTNISLQLADRTIKYPIGIIEDVPIWIRQLYIPTNFVIIEIEADSRIPIILDRYFIAISGVIKIVKQRKPRL